MQQIELQRNYAGIHGIGFSRRFSAADLPNVVARMKQSGFSEFRVWPEDPLRNEYHAIVYLQPQTHRNRAVMGFDMHTEPVRREAMDKARDTGGPAASGRVTLIQESTDPQNSQAGFIYAPVYRKDANISDQGDLRNALLGFVYSPYRIDDFLAPITAESSTT